MSTYDLVEEVDVGYTDDFNKNIINMYCNLKHSEYSLDYCRFERVSDAKGFFLSPGIGKDRYRYVKKVMMNDESIINQIIYNNIKKIKKLLLYIIEKENYFHIKLFTEFI